MDYYQSAADVSITFDRAILEIVDHGLQHGGVDYYQFVLDMPRASFPRPAQDVLTWLGY